MPRNLGAGLAAEIQKQQLMPIFLAKFMFDSGDLNLWNGIGTLAWSESVYIGAGNMGSFSAIVETGQIRASSVTFSLSGVDQQIIALALQEEYQGRRVRLWFGALDTNFALVATPFMIFAGRMDFMSIHEETERSNIELTCENELVILRRPQERRFTDEDQRLDFPDDSFFSRVPLLQDREVLFGKADVGGAAPLTFAGSGSSAVDRREAPHGSEPLRDK
jgi:hypothetical protein